jgi:hypothetical protein
MLTKPTLINIVVFMERASKSLTNTQEHLAFTQTYQAVHKEIAKIDKREQEKKP